MDTAKFIDACKIGDVLTVKKLLMDSYEEKSKHIYAKEEGLFLHVSMVG